MTLTSDSIIISTVEHCKNAQEICAEMTRKGKAIRFHVDCGVTANVLPAKYVRHKEINPTNKVLQMWNKSELKREGVTIRFCAGSRHQTANVQSRQVEDH